MLWYNLTLLCVAFLAITYGQETSVNLLVDNEQVAEEETVTFTCEVYNLMAGMFLRWRKIVPGLPPINVATNHFLEPDFKNEGRFTTTGPSDQDSTPFIYTFSVNPTNMGDSGMYQCGVHGGPTPIYQTRNLTVIKDVTEESLSFIYITNGEPIDIEDKAEIKYKNEDDLIVTCSVSQVFPEPIIEISLSGQPIEDSELLEPAQKEEHFQVVDETLGVVEQWVTVTKKYKTRVTYGHAGEEVKCAAMLPGREKISRGFRIKMNVLPPSLSCPSEVMAEEFSMDLRIMCNVTSRPDITDFNVVYYLNNAMTEQNKRMLSTREGNDTGGDYLLQISKDYSQVFLVLPGVYKQDFRTYTFIVENPAGTASAQVILLRDPNSPEIVDTATKAGATTVLLLITSIIVHLLH